MAPARLSPPLAPIIGGEVIQSSQPPKRPTLRRKRAAVDLGEVQDLETPPSPTKRARVAFNNEVEINVVEEWDSDPGQIHEQVRRALESHQNGDDEQYDNIKQIFAPQNGSAETPSPSTTRYYTSAILSNISLVGRSCEDLVQVLLKSDWFRRDDAYVSLYRRVIGNLVMTNGRWLSPVLCALVEKFSQIPPLTVSSAGLPAVTPRQIRLRIHESLQMLLKLVPTAGHELAHILSNQFPNLFESKRAHVRYVHNLQEITRYAPELRSAILAEITDRIVKIDVQVQVDMEDLPEEAAEDILLGVTQSTIDFMDESDDESGDDSDAESIIEGQEQSTTIRDITANIQKLDLLMDMTFEYYTNTTTKSSNSVTAPDFATLNVLLSHFHSTILPTHQSRHAQFLLFHFVQTHEDLIDHFVELLIRTVSDATKGPLIRQHAASYLASFVARGKHVSGSIVREVFDIISLQLVQLRAKYISDYCGPDPRRYSTYYALCQALFYIFCFRWRDLVVTADDNITPSPKSMLYSPDREEDLMEQHPTFLPEVKETFILHCLKGLNPLKVCAAAIVEQFAQITYQLGIIYINTLLESNRRVRIIRNNPIERRQISLSSLKDEEYWSDSYFPFDPYKLPKSKRWLEGDYREWQPLSGADEGVDQDSDSDGEDSEVDADEDSDDESIGTDGGNE